MTSSKAKIAANARYTAKNYKMLSVNIKPSDYNIIDNYCKTNNISKARFVVDACKYYIDNKQIKE